jgi:hypothetical protein
MWFLESSAERGVRSGRVYAAGCPKWSDGWPLLADSRIRTETKNVLRERPGSARFTRGDKRTFARRFS